MALRCLYQSSSDDEFVVDKKKIVELSDSDHVTNDNNNNDLIAQYKIHQNHIQSIKQMFDQENRSFFVKAQQILKKKDQTITKLKEQLKSVTEELEEIRNENEEMKDEIEEIRNENEEMKDEIEEIRNENDEMKNEIEDLKQENENLRSSETKYKLLIKLFKIRIQRLKKEAAENPQKREVVIDQNVVSDIDSILCSTIRGAYVSYNQATLASGKVDKRYPGIRSIAYSILCDLARGKYCSYDTSTKCARKIAKAIAKQRIGQ
ncbi:hypothetical protein TRFO_33817 [Tritrichomonas foetus]|uniref:Uncharacterized protein n=1 Tax=Tritrichomonas foetus TaxID=1144522 RepID=A0A1J4JQD0_9EUKA|nr:hypothetical protein TRFO_33817 [Tritrichomonas foetus]|eukprot:OHS99733.1 hypothetical protein TRFO_33817 [Tritrichomonas foetus]